MVVPDEGKQGKNDKQGTEALKEVGQSHEWYDSEGEVEWINTNVPASVYWPLGQE